MASERSKKYSRERARRLNKRLDEKRRYAKRSVVRTRDIDVIIRRSSSFILLVYFLLYYLFALLFSTRERLLCFIFVYVFFVFSLYRRWTVPGVLCRNVIAYDRTGIIPLPRTRISLTTTTSVLVVAERFCVLIRKVLVRLSEAIRQVQAIIDFAVDPAS